jgi:hypothetical protein
MQAAMHEHSRYTSRKEGFRPARNWALAPVESRTGTNDSISPGSSGQDAARGPRRISPGSYWTFSPGSWLDPGLKAVRPG